MGRHGCDAGLVLPLLLSKLRWHRCHSDLSPDCAACLPACLPVCSTQHHPLSPTQKSQSQPCLCLCPDDEGHPAFFLSPDRAALLLRACAADDQGHQGIGCYPQPQLGEGWVGGWVGRSAVQSAAGAPTDPGGGSGQVPPARSGRPPPQGQQGFLTLSPPLHIPCCAGLVCDVSVAPAAGLCGDS